MMSLTSHAVFDELADAREQLKKISTKSEGSNLSSQAVTAAG